MTKSVKETSWDFVQLFLPLGVIARWLMTLAQDLVILHSKGVKKLGFQPFATEQAPVRVQGLVDKKLNPPPLIPPMCFLLTLNAISSSPFPANFTSPISQNRDMIKRRAWHSMIRWVEPSCAVPRPAQRRWSVMCWTRPNKYWRATHAKKMDIGFSRAIVDFFRLRWDCPLPVCSHDTHFNDCGA